MFDNAAEVGGTSRFQAHVTSIGSYCNNERNILFRLAYLITGDEVQAEDSVIAAYDLARQRKTPFRDWPLEWAKCATVRSAIQARSHKTRCREAHDTVLYPLRPSQRGRVR